MRRQKRSYPPVRIKMALVEWWHYLQSDLATDPLIKMGHPCFYLAFRCLRNVKLHSKFQGTVMHDWKYLNGKNQHMDWKWHPARLWGPEQHGSVSLKQKKAKKICQDPHHYNSGLSTQLSPGKEKAWGPDRGLRGVSCLRPSEFVPSTMVTLRVRMWKYCTTALFSALLWKMEGPVFYLVPWAPASVWTSLNIKPEIFMYVSLSQELFIRSTSVSAA